jgi:hypothetical protein
LTTKARGGEDRRRTLIHEGQADLMRAIHARIPLFALVLILSCGQGEDQVSIDTPTQSPPVVFPTPDGESEFPIYREPPVRLTPGRFASPLDTPEEQQAGDEAEVADKSKPKFDGFVQGIHLGVNPDPKEVQVFPCDKKEVGSIGSPSDEAKVRQSPHWFDAPSYLPAGAFDWTYPLGHTCGSNPSFDVYREFFVDGGGEIYIHRTIQEFAALDISKDRITTGTVGGLSAIIIPALTPEGHGDSHVIIKEASGGILRVSANGLPLSETKKVAEALVADLS